MRRPGLLSIVLATLAAAVFGALASCSTGSPQAALSWAPAPVEAGGLSTLASTVDVDGTPRVALHTDDGDVTFWGGVNMGATLPGTNPGELAVPAETYRRWFAEMADFGIRFVRIYTILPPYFYDELLAYNTAHPQAPLYLLQGVYLPDETYIESGNLYDADLTSAFTRELQEASAAVSGDLDRAPQRGRASGSWTSDVSPWVAAWIIGAELDGAAVKASDVANEGAPTTDGTYFRSSGSPTERWLAARMDELASAGAARGRSAPIAFVNWPTTDPLAHPVEPNPREDLVGIDANAIQPTQAWPGGTFASYHAYPYYPDFIRFEPGLQEPRPDGQVDRYLAYVSQLVDWHAKAGIPTMVTEFGVPSSLGLAHFGTSGRNQGGHDEAEAMEMDAQMMRGLTTTGASGGLLFIWADEWFKFTWNTAPRTLVVDAERRSLWRDPLTNEEHFGVISVDPIRTGWRQRYASPTGPVSEMRVDTDASYAYVDITFDGPPASPFTLGFDVIGGGASLPGSDGTDVISDVAVVIDPSEDSATAYVREDVDPILLDGLAPETIPAPDLPGWRMQRMSANRAVPATGGLPARDAEFYEVGRLISGSWDDPSDPQQDSRATWKLDGDTLQMRLPWSMLLLGDPSSKTAVVPVDGEPTAEEVSQIRTTLVSQGTITPLGIIDWDNWNYIDGTERVKKGAEAMSSAWHDVNLR